MSYEIPLVHEIEKRQCLYNSNLPEYNRKDVLDAAWSEVAASVNLTVNECKDKWKNIRSSFVRSLRTNGGKSKKPYYLTKYLQFVLPYLKPLGIDFIPDDSQAHTTDTIQLHDHTSDLAIKIEPDDFDVEQIRQYDSETFDPLRCLPKETVKSTRSMNLKRRQQMKHYANSLQRNKNKRPPVSLRMENNAMKYFLLSLLPELDTLAEDQVRMFKIKVMMLIDEIKNDSSKTKAEMKASVENVRLQKRLINLLLKNLEQKNDCVASD